MIIFNSRDVLTTIIGLAPYAFQRISRARQRIQYPSPKRSIIARARTHTEKKNGRTVQWKCGISIGIFAMQN